MAAHLVASVDKFKVKAREDVLGFVTNFKPDTVGI